MQELHRIGAIGETVAVRGARWLVTDRQMFAACDLVTLQGAASTNRGETLRLLSPFDVLRPRASTPRTRMVGRRRCLQHAAATVAEAHGWSDLATATNAAIDVHWWQLEPALAMVRGASRLLLADAVGSGKTIQAGLVLGELRARGLAERALVLAPAGLREQWRGELVARFGIDAIVVDHPSVMGLAANPWAGAPVIVTSIDLVKRLEHLTAVAHVPFDLLIVDEAHHVTPDSERGQVVARLADACPWLVLISATPHSGDARAFAFLSGLGGADDAPLVTFRRQPPRGSCGRRTRLHAVRATGAEAQLLDAATRYARAVWLDRGGTDAGARLVATTIARRAASSGAALAKTVGRRRRLMAGGEEARQPLLPWDETDDGDGDEDGALLAAAGLSDAAAEARWLDRLTSLAAAGVAGRPAKVAWLTRFLRRTGDEPVVVFSEFRDTVIDVAARLGGESVALLHGGLTPALRHEVVRRFTTGRTRVLLATDTAGEGLNLQQRCRTVITIDVPWNPNRLEQRIGRVDRLGQTKTVHAIHLWHADSIEQRVLAHLACRRSRADEALRLEGGSEDGETAVTAFGLGPLPRIRRVDPIISRAVEVRTPRSLGIEDRRRLSALRCADACSRPDDTRDESAIVWVARPSRRQRAARPWRCLFVVGLVDGDGRVVGRHLCPVDFEVAARWARQPEGRSLLASIAARASGADVRHAVACALASSLEVEMRGVREAAAAHARRLAAVRQRVTLPDADVQPMLFAVDARASAILARRRAGRTARLAQLETCAARVAALSGVHVEGPPRLVAAWPAR